MIASQLTGLGSVRTAAGASAGTSGTSPAALWYATVAAFAQTKLPTLVAVPFANEMQTQADPEMEQGPAVGSATITNQTSSPAGVIQLATGATANSARILRSLGHETAAYISNLRASKYAIATKVRIVVTQATFTFDLCSATDNIATGLTFGAIQAASNTNWACKLGAAAAVDLGVAFDTNWHTLLLIADQVNITFYVGNGDASGIVQVGNPQSQAPMSTNSGYWQTLCQNLGTAASIAHNIDRAMVLTENPSNLQ